MIFHDGLSSIFRVRHGPRRWVFLPHATLLGLFLLVGLAVEPDRGLLLAYFVLVPIFVIQIALPTFAGWIVAFSGWLTFCAIVILGELRSVRHGATVPISIWLLLALAVLSSAPLYLLRPRGKPVA